MRRFIGSAQPASIAYLVMVMLMLSPLVAQARPCPTTGLMAGLTGPSGKLVPTWDADTPKWGIRELFVGDGQCVSCHSPGGSGASSYITCSACHAGLIGDMDNPDWLNFAASDGSSAKLLRNSYSAPGHTKASAALFRATSGSMPPGQDGWCDEIVDTFEQWIAAGYPNN